MPVTRVAASALMATLLAGSTGCTVAGLVLGSAIPRCPPPEAKPVDFAALPIGTDVEVSYLTNPDPSGQGRIAKIEGVYRGTDWTRVYVESEEKSYGIPFSRLRETRPREGPRTYALQGLYVGLTLDAVFVTLLWLNRVSIGSGGGERY
jgi:hypothetical protein